MTKTKKKKRGKAAMEMNEYLLQTEVLNSLCQKNLLRSEFKDGQFFFVLTPAGKAHAKKMVEENSEWRKVFLNLFLAFLAREYQGKEFKIFLAAFLATEKWLNENFNASFKEVL